VVCGWQAAKGGAGRARATLMEFVTHGLAGR
jgi:hypothetical protein